MTTPRILVVEDDRYLLGILRDYLGYVGLEVVEASDGEAGWQSFLAAPPDVVLSDVLLPHLNGLELAARIKSSRPDVPVMLMSAVYKDQETIDRNLRQCGADDYIVKPFSMPDLRGHLARLCPAIENFDSVADVGTPALEEELSMVHFRPGSEQPVAGNIAPDFLTPLLLQLRIASHTGVLELRDAARWKDIVLLNGRPVWADGGDGHDRLGTMLLEDGVIAQEQFAEAVDFMREEGVDFGSALTDRKLLSPTDLYAQLRRLVERRVVAAFAWTVGSWTLTSEFPRQTSSFEASPLPTIWKGLKAHALMQPIREEMTRYRERYVVPSRRFESDFAELKKDEEIGFLGTFLNGRRRVADLLEMEILEASDLDRALWLMFKAGMVGFGLHPAAEDEPGIGGVAGPSTLELPELRFSLTAVGEEIIRDYLRLWQTDFFRIFGVDVNSGEEEIAAALGEKQLSFDPMDLPPDLPSDVRSKAASLQEWVSEGRRTLSDPEARRAYSRRFKEGLTGVYRKVSKARETEAAMFFEMGKAFIQTRDYREAELSFAKAVERAPSTAEYVAYQGWATYRRDGAHGDGAAAADALIDRSLALDDHLPIAWYFSGIIHRDQRRYGQAIQAFESALSFDSQFEAARKALQQTAELTGR